MSFCLSPGAGAVHALRYELEDLDPSPVKTEYVNARMGQRRQFAQMLEIWE